MRINYIKELICLFAIFTFLNGCSKDDFTYEDVFKNDTEFNVVVEPHQIVLDYIDETFKLEIKPYETKSIRSDEIYALFQVASSETDKNFSYKLTNSTNVIYCYNFKVSYVISGTSEKANLTYSTPSGGTGQRSSISLPYRIDYDKFGGDFLYISAQNDTDRGSVKVEIYYEDRLVASDTANGAYSIATASK